MRRCRILEDLSTDELTCIALATTALETPDFSNKQVVVEWLQSPHVGELLVSRAQCVSSLAKEDEDSAVSWRLLRSAISARKLPSKG